MIVHKSSEHEIVDIIGGDPPPQTHLPSANLFI